MVFEYPDEHIYDQTKYSTIHRLAVAKTTLPKKKLHHHVGSLSFIVDQVNLLESRILHAQSLFTILALAIYHSSSQSARQTCNEKWVSLRLNAV